MKTVTRIVVLEVTQDYEDKKGDPPEWWEALGLSAPWRWEEEARERGAFVRAIVERTLA